MSPAGLFGTVTMTEPDALKCPGCGELLPASVEMLTGAVRCERCGVEVPIPEPVVPDLVFDSPPPELPAPDTAAVPAVDLPPTPRVLDIEHWFPDAATPAADPPSTDPLVVSEEFGPIAELQAAEVPDTNELDNADRASFTQLYTTPVPVPVEQTHRLPVNTDPPDYAPPVGNASTIETQRVVHPAEPLPPPTEGVPPPLPEGLTVFDAPIPGVPLLPTPPVLIVAPEEPEVLVPDEPVPVVQPIVPLMKPVHDAATDRPRKSKPEPRSHDEAERRPKPQVGVALIVMAILFVVVAIGLAVIGYAIWSGLQTAAKPRRADLIPWVNGVDRGHAPERTTIERIDSVFWRSGPGTNRIMASRGKR